MSKRILITPRSLTQGHSPDLQPDRSFKPGEEFCWMSLEEVLARAAFD